MKVLRTPDERFVDLPGYPFAPNYIEIEDGEGGTLRVHYVDEGPRDACPVLLMHGEPSWSYLYRKMIPLIAAAGHRVIAPDLVGFGRSDKPAEKSDYSYTRHVRWVEQVVLGLDLTDVTLFGQDWGSIVGLAVAARNEQRFSRIVIANGGLPDPRRPEYMAAKITENSSNPAAFAQWQEYVASCDDLPMDQVLKGGSGMIDGVAQLALSDEEAACYLAPYPDPSFQAGPLTFPRLVLPQSADDDVFGTWVAAWEVLDRWNKPFLCMYGKADPVLGYFDEIFIESVPGAKGLAHRQFPNGGHFIQETEFEALAAGVNELIAST
jgi:haloalkane dehalogenase